MDNALKVIGGIFLVFFTVIFVGSLGVLGGIISGWIVGLFFTDLIIGTISRLNFINTAGLEVWHIGGTLGFIGAFFKSVQANAATATASK